MSDSIRDRVSAHMKDAMRDQDKTRLSTLRLISAAFKDREIQNRGTGKDDSLTESGMQEILSKMIKQRRESASQYRKGNREDLAGAEEAEIEVLCAYMPEPLSQEEIEALIDAAVESTGASSIRDMGKVMGQVKATAQGRADMGAVSALVKARLAGG